MNVHLKRSFSDPLLDVMNFLSEVTRDHPDAISFATGSPMEHFFDVKGAIKAIDYFVEYRARVTNTPPEIVRNDLGQYNRTNGIINDLIAKHLRLDEGIDVRPEAVMVTSGSQEAMAVVMMGLFDAQTDVLLAADPTYIGITGLARVLNVPIIPVPAGENGLEVETVLAVLEQVRQSGKRPRALYDIPDFNNPLGVSMPREVRLDLLQAARANDLLIIEDNPYSMFVYDDAPPPTLKALDTEQVVLYMGTVSKTLFPGLRLGYLVANQAVEGSTLLLAQELSKVKSLTTVNTSQLLQAAVGGLLLEMDCSLRPAVAGKLPFYRSNRDRMVARLADEFRDEHRQGLVRWNCPGGGFFLTVTLPFEFNDECFRTCAREYGLLCCPMSFFSLGSARNNQLRLSFSYVTPDQIDEGIYRLGRFVRDRVNTGVAISGSCEPTEDQGS